MEKLYQLSDSYNAIWLETSQLYEAWARQRGISFYELLVILSITEADGKEMCIRDRIRTLHCLSMDRMRLLRWRIFRQVTR